MSPVAFYSFLHLYFYWRLKRSEIDMLKLTKKADYGLIAVRHLAEHADLGACSAKDLAEMYGIPQEALAKILQRLARSKLLISQQGTNGGYVLSRDPRTISALEVIRAIEGPLFITSCNNSNKSCSTSSKCTVREPLQKVSRTIEEVLGRLSVWELREGAEDSARMASSAPVKDAHLLTTAEVGHRGNELVSIEVSGGNYGK
jgi:Rrf2 family protein